MNEQISPVKPWDETELKERLTVMQFHVTQQDGTEPSFNNEYFDNEKSGIYVDAVSREPLFASLHKFKSGTGWPSFFQPLVNENVHTGKDFKLGYARTEVRSRVGNSHLGHVFDDGPKPTGLRYCINSAALSFIPKETLIEEGYAEFLPLFDQNVKVVEQTAYFAAGCFWGVEEMFDKLDVVTHVEVGYMGGQVKDPTYKQVCSGDTGHAEAVKVNYDPKKITYEKLVEYFFKIHDPTTLNRQGNDRGTQYRSAIFYTNERQHRMAEAVKARMNQEGKWDGEITTSIDKAATFWRAEAYHQDYLEKNKNGYRCPAHHLRNL